MRPSLLAFIPSLADLWHAGIWIGAVLLVTAVLLAEIYLFSKIHHALTGGREW